MAFLSSKNSQIRQIWLLKEPSGNPDSGTAGTKAEAAETSSRYFPSVKVKAEPVAALMEDGTEADDEAEDSVNWIGRRQGDSARFASQRTPPTTTFAGDREIGR